MGDVFRFALGGALYRVTVDETGVTVETGPKSDQSKIASRKVCKFSRVGEVFLARSGSRKTIESLSFQITGGEAVDFAALAPREGWDDADLKAFRAAAVAALTALSKARPEMRVTMGQNPRLSSAMTVVGLIAAAALAGALLWLGGKWPPDWFTGTIVAIVLVNAVVVTARRLWAGRKPEVKSAAEAAAALAARV